jgi:hypothetical protein
MGDSELVINQMRGQYKVRDAQLRLYHVVAQGLAARFRSVSYEHVTREQNQRCDVEAQRWTKPERRQEWDRAKVGLYYPNLLAALAVSVEGRPTYASNEVGSAHPTKLDMVDADFFVSLMGENALQRLADPFPMTALNGKVGAIEHPRHVQLGTGDQLQG